MLLQECTRANKKMMSKSCFNRILKVLLFYALLFFWVAICNGSESTEFKLLRGFIKAVDPGNVLNYGHNVHYSCQNKLKGVECNTETADSITAIRLENRQLSGTLDVDSLCKLPNLRVVSLTRNRIRGTISNSIVHCRRLAYLDLSNNLLSGFVPKGLDKLKYQRRLHISNNYFTREIPSSIEEYQLHSHFKKSKTSKRHMAMIKQSADHQMRIMLESESPKSSPDDKHKNWKHIITFLPYVGIGLMMVFVFFAGRKAAKLATQISILKSLREYSTPKSPPAKVKEEEKPVENRSELVFFVDEHESFKLEDLLEATADLRNQSFCSSLYKVTLENNASYAVKRLKKLQVPFDEFGQAMKQIGKMKHPNILPLIGYNSTNYEKLLIYKFQNNGSLLNLLEDYTAGKRDFPWRLRLSLACGISRGLDFIYKNSEESTPHGNLKLSNILLDKKDEPLISEYGFSNFFDPLKGCVILSKGYTAPEKGFSEKGDVYSFGVILLELLTGKTVETSGIDLPKWVTAVVKEEWTGEVFDKEVAKAAKEWAFPLLNIALKCVAELPQSRPSVAEIHRKIEEVVLDNSNTSDCTTECGAYEDNFRMLHSIIPETWDTPGSNY